MKSSKNRIRAKSNIGIFEDISQKPNYKFVNSTKIVLSIHPSLSYLSEPIAYDSLKIFNKRSKTKCRIINYRKDYIAFKTNKSVYVETSNQEIEFVFKKYLSKEYHLEDAHKNGAIFCSDRCIALVCFKSSTLKEYKFKWNPYRAAISDRTFIIGTRERPEGPGELYCFNSFGELNWAIRYTATQSGMGMFSGGINYVQPYDIFTDLGVHNQIIIQSFDLISIHNEETPVGYYTSLRAFREIENKKRRSNIDFELKQILSTANNDSERHSALSKAFADGSCIDLEESMLPMPSPLGILEFGEAGNLFVLDSDNRLTSWTDSGDNSLCIHIASYSENYDEILELLNDDNHLIITYRSGITYWLDAEGNVVLACKMPSTVVQIIEHIDSNNVIILCNDGWIYSINKLNSLYKRLLPLKSKANLIMCFDIVMIIDEYLWITDKRSFLQHSLENNIEKQISYRKDQCSVKLVANYRNPKECGNVLWSYINENKERIILARYSPTQDYDVELIAYDFSFKIKWIHKFNGYLLKHLAISHDRNHIALVLQAEGMYNSEVHIYDIDGRLDSRLITKHLLGRVKFFNNAIEPYAFNSPSAIIPSLITRVADRWLIEDEDIRDRRRMKYLSNVKIRQIFINRNDNGIYEIHSQDGMYELYGKVKIHGIISYPGSNRHLIRVGNMKLICLTDDGEIVWEKKETRRIRGLVKGLNGIIVMTTVGIHLLNEEGEYLWECNAPFSDQYSSVAFHNKSMNYLWGVGNNISTSVYILNSNGKVIYQREYSERTELQQSELGAYFLLTSENSADLYKIHS